MVKIQILRDTSIVYSGTTREEPQHDDSTTRARLITELKLTCDSQQAAARAFETQKFETATK